jgi:hypothetical protein
MPSQSPSKPPTGIPTKTPTKAPVKAPSISPTKAPTMAPATSPSKLPTGIPTKTPTKSPVKAPSKSPTKAPTKAPAEGDEHFQSTSIQQPLSNPGSERVTTCEFVLEIRTDDFGAETSWTLIDTAPQSKVAVANERTYGNNETYRNNIQLFDGRYEFTIFDSFAEGSGDGIHPPGYYSIRLGGGLS